MPDSTLELAGDALNSQYSGETPEQWFERTKHRRAGSDPSSVPDVSGGFRPAGVPLMPSQGPEKPTGSQLVFAALSNLDQATPSDGTAAVLPVLAGVVALNLEASYAIGRDGGQAPDLSRKALGDETIGRVLERRSKDGLEFIRPLSVYSTDTTAIETALAIADDEHVAFGSRSEVERKNAWDRAFPGPGVTPHVSDQRPGLHNHEAVANELRKRRAILGRIETVQQRMSEHLRNAFPGVVAAAGGVGVLSGILAGARKVRRVYSDPEQVKALAAVEESLAAVRGDLEAIAGAADVKGYADSLKRQETVLKKQATDQKAAMDAQAANYIANVVDGSTKGDLSAFNAFMIEATQAAAVFPGPVHAEIAKADPLRSLGGQLLAEWASLFLPELEHVSP